MSDYKITKVQLELFKDIRTLEIHAIQYHIRQWHRKHDPELKRLARKIFKFHAKYLPKLKLFPLSKKRSWNGHRDPELWQLYDRDDSPPIKPVTEHIDNEIRYAVLIKSQKKIEEPYRTLVIKLQMLDARNGSLKSQGVI